MKRLQSMLVLMIFALCSITTSAQTSLNTGLLTTANLELSKVAQDNGYLLKTDATYLSFPVSNWFVPINTTTATTAMSIALIGGSSVLVGSIVIALFYPPIVTGTAYKMGLASFVSGVSGFVAVVYDKGTADFTGVEDHIENYVHFVDHFRTELHYEVVDSDSDETLEGSCIYFFSLDREESSLSYEIDNCTHDNVFPQNEEGVLRIGEDGPDFWDWRQTDVVANGNISFASLQDLGL